MCVRHKKEQEENHSRCRVAAQYRLQNMNYISVDQLVDGGPIVGHKIIYTFVGKTLLDLKHISVVGII